MAERIQPSANRDEATARVLQALRDYESPNVTYQAPDGSWPIVWTFARGMHISDLAGRKYLDLTAAFGVAAAGHANQRVVRAGTRQMRQLLHAMGDVHPHPVKAELARVLSRITYERWTAGSAGGSVRGRVVWGNSGFEAVEAALKTAMLATGRRGVLAFGRGYHGLGYGALEVTGRDLFRRPFASQLGGFADFLSYPESREAMSVILERVDARLAAGDVGAVLVEPIQGRGGIRVPPRGFLGGLRMICEAHHVLLIADEVYTGFGRTGYWFGCEVDSVVPDLICLGKALTGGFPLSACVGRAELMEAAWPASTGEALHTSTFLGHPVGCAMALAQIGEIERRELVRQSEVRGRQLLAMLGTLGAANSRLRVAVRGRGLMVGIEMSGLNERPATLEVWEVVRGLLRRGFLVLPEGEHGEVLALTPPLIIRRAQLSAAVEAIRDALGDL